MLRRRDLMGVLGGNTPAPLINLSLTDAVNNVIVNKGTGGSAYNATITDYSASEKHVSNANGLTLNKRAYAKVMYGISPSKSFTLCVRGRINTTSALTYQMIFWTEKDSLSVYRSSGNTFNIKLTNQKSGMIADSPKASVTSSGVALNINTSYISYHNDHTYVFVGNTEAGYVSLYIDGELIGRQPMPSLLVSTSILLGDNSGKYYANQITISDVRIWDYAVDINSI